MGLSGLPSCRELILGVTLESLQGNEALSQVDGCREPAYCILSAYCILHIECSTFHSIIFQDLE